MHPGGLDGWVEVITGVMFSGKSEELLRRVRRAIIAKQHVQIFKSRLDERYGRIDRLRSDDGERIEAHPIRAAREIRELLTPETRVVGIDQAHFLDFGIVSTVRWLADRQVRVIVAGTDLDFRGEPFGPMGELLTVAEVVDKLHAICSTCGSPATRNQRLIDGEPAPAEGPLILIGGAGTYEARCRRCHEVPPPDRHQTELDIATEADAWTDRVPYW